MPLMRYNDILLRRDDGTLACSEDDCCDLPPCPDCCIRITSGVLINGEIKIFAFVGANSMEITIATESGTRIVCPGEEIEINILFQVDGEDPNISPQAYLQFDPAWEMTGNSPEPTASRDYPGGYADWGNQPDEQYNATLELTSCFFYEYRSLGLIYVSGLGIEQYIGIEVCAPELLCCTHPVECEPCCYRMPINDFFVGGVGVVDYEWQWSSKRNRWERLVENNGWWFVFWLVPPDQDHPTLICPETEDGTELTFRIGVVLGPPRNAAAQSIRVTFETGEFEEKEWSPGFGVLSPEEDEIVWESEAAPDFTPPLEYEATLGFGCEHPGQSAIWMTVAIDTDGNELTTEAGASALLDLFYCGEGPFCVACGDCCFDRSSKITGYSYIEYEGTTPLSMYLGNRDFPYMGNCCFDQEYQFYLWDGTEWVFQGIVEDGGEESGFCYVPGLGWWDGNEAGHDANQDGVTVQGGRSYFGEDICEGVVSVTYYYTATRRAVVSFTVVE